MTSFFPDVNVWLALSVSSHIHTAAAWEWLQLVSVDDRLVFSRITQLGLLRLLTNEAVMGSQALSLGKAWQTYDVWLSDPRVEFHPESRNLDASFRQVTEPFAGMKAPKIVGDCFLLASAKESEATLVTFDKALSRQARNAGFPAIVPG